MTDIGTPTKDRGATGRTWGALPWVPIVVLLGGALGLVEILLWPVHGGPGGPPPHGPVTPLPSAEAFAVLSAVNCALLIALVAVYVRTFAETQSQFALGLVFVLVALLFEAIVSSPFVFALFGYGPGNVGAFLALGSALEVVALVVFLALSLE